MDAARSPGFVRDVIANTPPHMFASPTVIAVHRGVAKLTCGGHTVPIDEGQGVAVDPFTSFTVTLDDRTALREIVGVPAGATRCLPAQNLPRSIRDACEIARREWRSPIRVRELARHAGLSVYHFTRRFHETVGIPPFQYLDQLRVAHACAMLATGASATAAAHDCGFADQSHLTRRFKRVLGETPGQFARAVRPLSTGA